jgi:hypothetical protein
MGPSGPFAHIDVRGTRARWLDWGGTKRRRTPAGLAQLGGSSAERISSGCTATASSAALCTRARR